MKMYHELKSLSQPHIFFVSYGFLWIQQSIDKLLALFTKGDTERGWERMGERGGEFSAINCRATAISVESINVCARVCVYCIALCTLDMCTHARAHNFKYTPKRHCFRLFLASISHWCATGKHKKNAQYGVCFVVCWLLDCLYHILISHPFMGKGSAGSTTNGGCGGGGGGMEKLGILLNSNKNGMIRSNKRTK